MASSQLNLSSASTLLDTIQNGVAPEGTLGWGLALTVRHRWSHTKDGRKSSLRGAECVRRIGEGCRLPLSGLAPRRVGLVRTSETFGYLFQGAYEECVRYLMDSLPAPREGETVEGSLYSTGEGSERGNLVLRGGERIPVHTPEPLVLWFLGAGKVTLVLGHLEDGAYIIKTASRFGCGSANDILITWTNPKYPSGDPS